MTDGLRYKMVVECARRYKFTGNDDGSATIVIEVDKRFADLWLEKITELYTDDAEIAEYEPEGD